MFGAAHKRSSKYVLCNVGQDDSTQATTGEFGKIAVQQVICIILNGLDKIGSAGIMTIMYGIVQDGKREIHIGDHSVILIAIWPMPRSARDLNGQGSDPIVEGNRADDSSPDKVHKSLHDKNLLDVIGSALLN